MMTKMNELPDWLRSRYFLMNSNKMQHMRGGQKDVSVLPSPCNFLAAKLAWIYIVLLPIGEKTKKQAFIFPQ